MAEKPEHKHWGVHRLILYLSGKLTGKEMNSFERQLEKDTFEAEAMEGFAALSPDQLRDDLQEIRMRIHKRTQKKQYLPYLRIAAGLALLAALSLSYFMIFDRHVGDSAENYRLAERPEEEAGKEIDRVQDSMPVLQDRNLMLEEEPMKRQAIAAVEKQETQAASLTEEKSEESPLKAETIEFDVMQDADSQVLNETTESLAEPSLEVTGREEFVVQEMSRLPQKSFSAKKEGIPRGLISGKVISMEDSTPVPGVAIRIRGVSGISYTDMAGNFEMERTGTDSVLIASLPGLETKEVSIPESGNMNIAMQPEDLSLDEVVVIDYGYTRDKSAAVERVTSGESSNPVKNDYISASPVSGFDEFKNYISENMHFPDGEGYPERVVVVLKFSIDQAGNPQRIRIIRTENEAFSKEAIRLLMNGPRWNPPSWNGIYQNEETRLRIVFNKPENH